MKMKKMMSLTAAMMVAVMAFTGCGGSEAPAEEAASGDVYKIGIIQQMEHGSLDEATNGFMDKLTELLGEGNVEFDYQNAQGEQANCTTISTKFVSDGVDLIMANATTALQTAAAATADIPIVGTSVTDYVTAGVIESNDAPGTNVTGVSDLASVEAQVDVLMQFCDPENTKVAIVYCSAEPNSIFQYDLAAAYLDTLGVPYAAYTVADSNEIQSIVTNAVADCNAMFILADNTLANNMEIVKNITVPAGVPTVAGAEAMCQVGALSTIAISYYDLGQKAAEMAYDILVNGANPAEMSIEYMTDGIVPKYNPEIAEALGVTIPEGMEPIA
ncbi:ABC transporter substrate-binding protein [Anaerotignum sp.]|nr:ABC transporter substrate-binding protein [Anaerotignum sp.]MBQ7758211.1 ABC transporter substrate-binding protein [Anaerotignum sp.]